MPGSVNFLSKLIPIIKKAGSEIALKAAQVYFVTKNPATPVWAKRLIWGALIYLLLPTDAVPDFIPVVGFSDDLSLLLGVMGSVKMYLTDDVKKQAHDWVAQWSSRSSPEA